MCECAQFLQAGDWSGRCCQRRPDRGEAVTGKPIWCTVRELEYFMTDVCVSGVVEASVGGEREADHGTRSELLCCS